MINKSFIHNIQQNKKIYLLKQSILKDLLFSRVLRQEKRGDLVEIKMVGAPFNGHAIIQIKGQSSRDAAVSVHVAAWLASCKTKGFDKTGQESCKITKTDWQLIEELNAVLSWDKHGKFEQFKLCKDASESEGASERARGEGEHCNMSIMQSCFRLVTSQAYKHETTIDRVQSDH